MRRLAVARGSLLVASPIQFLSHPTENRVCRIARSGGSLFPKLDVGKRYQGSLPRSIKSFCCNTPAKRPENIDFYW